jgi:hypothetical protein
MAYYTKVLQPAILIGNVDYRLDGDRPFLPVCLGQVKSNARPHK